MALRIIPCTLKQANQVVTLLHRHHKPVVGHRFSLAVRDEQHFHGAAIVGRPVAREISQYEVAEVTRLVTDGTKNACSILYAACARVAKEMGFLKIQTYILEDEPGISLTAAGWRFDVQTSGGDWNHSWRKGRRVDQPMVRKQRWIKELNKCTTSSTPSTSPKTPAITSSAANAATPIVAPSKPSTNAVHVMRIATGEAEDTVPDDGKNAAAVALGRLGGKARATGMSAKKRKEIAKKAAAKRWSKSVPDSLLTADEAISAAQDVTFIKSVLKVSTSELAKCIGVTRQSLYNWKAGSQIKDRNAESVHQLKAAATLLAQEGLGATAHTLRRTLPGGKTLLETIRTGGDGRAAAQSLITMLRDEQAIQRKLADRFSGRAMPSKASVTPSTRARRPRS